MSALIRDRKGHTDTVKMEAEFVVMQPQTKEPQEPLEAGKGERWPPPRTLGGNTILLTPWFQISGCQNYERISCCFKPLSLWTFVRAALRHYSMHWSLFCVLLGPTGETIPPPWPDGLTHPSWGLSVCGGDHSTPTLNKPHPSLTGSKTCPFLPMGSRSGRSQQWRIFF